MGRSCTAVPDDHGKSRDDRDAINSHMPVGLPTPRDIDIESLLAILPHHDETPTHQHAR
jgi:hypothetical protein